MTRHTERDLTRLGLLPVLALLCACSSEPEIRPAPAEQVVATKAPTREAPGEMTVTAAKIEKEPPVEIPAVMVPSGLANAQGYGRPADYPRCDADSDCTLIDGPCGQVVSAHVSVAEEEARRNAALGRLATCGRYDHPGPSRAICRNRVCAHEPLP